MIVPDLFLGLVALLLVIFPGWFVFRSQNQPLPVLAGFMVGAVGLVALVLILEAADRGIATQSIIPAWLIVSLGTVLIGRKSIPKTTSSKPSAQRDWLFLLPVIPASAVIIYRATMQPLFGVDTVFRWNFLAEQMFSRGTLAFYPPVTAADYSIYAWPDGIAPVVSSLYFWTYSLANASRPVLTAPLIILQFFLVLVAAYAIAQKLVSTRAATIACALVACSPILLWSTAMGQESGILTIALLGILVYLPSSRNEASSSAAIIAGFAAALGGLAREYGLIFILFGLVLGIIRRLPLRNLGLFAIVALLGTIPWYTRNWLRTGNPFFNLDVAGLFPVNAAHVALMKVYEGSFGWGQLPPAALRILLTNCTAAVIGVIAGACFCFSRSRVMLAAFSLLVGLWAASLGYTAAGFTYSLRVLSPALAVAAVLGGCVISKWVPGRGYSSGLLIALSAFACDASLRTLALPANIYKVPVTSWLDVGNAIQQYHRRPVYRQLANFTQGRRILVLGPNALLNQNGARTVPLWSPEVLFLWQESVSEDSAVQQLHEHGIGFVLLTTGEVNRQYLANVPFFNRRPSPLQTVWHDDDMALFKVK
ncbi:MAG TPA: hypothetical protein VGM64_05460 [Lacunisphaera sp.]|jgi:hypothetical protein